MKHTAFTVLSVLAGNAYSQALSRTGNVIDDNGEGSGGANGAIFIIVGALLGLLVTLFKPDLDTKVCVILGAILGVIFTVVFGLIR
jgi:hypothetical protein